MQKAEFTRAPESGDCDNLRPAMIRQRGAPAWQKSRNQGPPKNFTATHNGEDLRSDWLDVSVSLNFPACEFVYSTALPVDL